MTVRENYIDVAKGIGLILVIAGHLFTYGHGISSIIFSFHMPLFFFLSGMVFRKRTMAWKNYLEKNVKRLIYPYVGYVLLGMVISMLIPAWHIDWTLRKILADLYLGAPEHFHVGQVWFLICLFWVVIAYGWLHEHWLKAKDWKYKAIFMLGVAVFAKLMAVMVVLLPGHRLPLKLDSAFMALCFYGLGHLFHDNFAEWKNIVFRNDIYIFSGGDNPPLLV